MSTNVPQKHPNASPRVTLPGTRYHRVRKTVQSICVVIFILLPLTDAMRVDITRQRFYFFGAELWISEFSMIYGRFYCGYLCPQMIFSEAASMLQKKIVRTVNRKLSELSAATKAWIASVAFYIVLLPASVFVSFVFMSFFIPPVDLFHRLLSFDIRTAGGIVGASVTLLTFLDFAVLRQRFCTAICPYGYLQNMLADKHTLLVHFHDPNKQCIHCEKCVRTCPMGIDIRESSHQLECTHCAECVDACSGVISKLGRPTLIQYAWGDNRDAIETHLKWYQRIGLRDGKRVAVLVLLFIYATGLSIAIGMRQPVLVRVMPDRSSLYTLSPDGLIHNRFRIVASNRGRSESRLTLTLSGLSSAAIVGVDKGVTLQPGESLQQEFDVVASTLSVTPGINRMRIVAVVNPGQKPQTFDENFFAPFEMQTGPSAGKKQ